MACMVVFLGRDHLNQHGILSCTQTEEQIMIPVTENRPRPLPDSYSNYSTLCDLCSLSSIVK